MTVARQRAGRPTAPGSSTAPPDPPPPPDAADTDAVAQRTRLSFVLALLSLALPLACIFLSHQGEIVVAMQLLGVGAIVGGVAIFLSHGGRRVTGAGIYSLTAGLMCGAGSYYWSVNDSIQSSRHGIFLTAVAIFATTAIMYALFWDGSVPHVDTRTLNVPPLSAVQAQSVSAVGIGLFVLGLASTRLGLSFGTLNTALADVGVCIFVSSLLLAGDAKILGSPIRTVVIGGVFLVYYVFVFTGNGRLRLAFLAITIAVVAQYRARANLKVIGLVLLLPILGLFAFIGQARVSANAEASANGLGSLVYPLSTVGQLIDGNITDGHGSTLVSEVVLLVPRQVWPGKPDQFGRVLALRLRPGSQNTRLALPCMPQGEFYYNFGWLGLIPMIGLLGYLIRKMDQAFARRYRRPLSTYPNIYSFIILAILIGSMSDLAWGGTPTWNNRNIQRLVIAIPVLLISMVVSRNRNAAKPAVVSNAR